MLERRLKIGIEQNILAKFVAAKYLPVVHWMESAISVMKLLGVKLLMGWDHGVRLQQSTMGYH